MAKKSLPWVDLLAKVTPKMTGLRDEVTQLMADATELDAQASELRGQAYFKALEIESLAKAENGIAAVDHVRNMATF